MQATVRSWGNFPQLGPAELVPLYWRHEPLPAAGAPMLPLGLARSYGDSCLNAGGTLLATRGLDRLLAFDRASGVLRCEAGMSLSELMELVLPAGWFPPVVPGTAFVTVGGAIANDVHGKNHHAAGTFGHHVRRFELLRSDGSRLECALDRHAELFRATIGGLGLTGLVTWAEIALARVPSGWFDVETRAMRDLDEFFALTAESAGHAYTVAWIDALARGAATGRGLFMRGMPVADDRPLPAFRPRLAMPVNLPAATLNRVTVGLFNRLYGARAGASWKRTREPYRRFLFPLDGIAHWNRMYGKPGFVQHQSVVPRGDAPAKLREMLAAIAAAGDASFLTVLKVFGDQERAGMMSFARPGVTLALDIPLRGAATFALLDRLDAVVRDAGGAIYPAKDARMSPETFRASFPAHAEFARHVDPAFSSSFWRRVAA